MKFFTSTIVIIVAVVIVLGFIFGGTPREARLAKLDDIRVGNLQEMQYQILEYWRVNRTLPVTLEDTKFYISGFAVTDPETNEPYKYEKLGDLKFKLCANFALEQNLDGKFGEFSRPRIAEPLMIGEKGIDYRVLNETWSHPAGDYCFEREIEVVTSTVR